MDDETWITCQACGGDGFFANDDHGRTYAVTERCDECEGFGGFLMDEDDGQPCEFKEQQTNATQTERQGIYKKISD